MNSQLVHLAPSCQPQLSGRFQAGAGPQCNKAGASQGPPHPLDLPPAGPGSHRGLGTDGPYFSGGHGALPWGAANEGAQGPAWSGGCYQEVRTPPIPAGSVSYLSGALGHWPGGRGRGTGPGGGGSAGSGKQGSVNSETATQDPPHSHTQNPGSQGSVPPLHHQAQAGRNLPAQGVLSTDPFTHFIMRSSCGQAPCSQQHRDLPLEAHSLAWGGNRPWKGDWQMHTGQGRAASRTRGLRTPELRG